MTEACDDRSSASLCTERSAWSAFLCEERCQPQTATGGRRRQRGPDPGVRWVGRRVAGLPHAPHRSRRNWWARVRV